MVVGGGGTLAEAWPSGWGHDEWACGFNSIFFRFNVTTWADLKLSVHEASGACQVHPVPAHSSISCANLQSSVPLKHKDKDEEAGAGFIPCSDRNRALRRPWVHRLLAERQRFQQDDRSSLLRSSCSALCLTGGLRPFTQKLQWSKPIHVLHLIHLIPSWHRQSSDNQDVPVRDH